MIKQSNLMIIADSKGGGNNIHMQLSIEFEFRLRKSKVTVNVLRENTESSL